MSVIVRAVLRSQTELGYLVDNQPQHQPLYVYLTRERPGEWQWRHVGADEARRIAPGVPVAACGRCDWAGFTEEARVAHVHTHRPALLEWARAVLARRRKAARDQPRAYPTGTVWASEPPGK